MTELQRIEIPQKATQTDYIVQPEYTPQVERAFKGNEDLKEHCELLFRLQRGKIKDMLAALEKRAGTVPAATATLEACKRCIDHFAPTFPEDTPRGELKVFPEQELQFGKAWNTATIKRVPRVGKSGIPMPAIELELQVSLKTWRDRSTPSAESHDEESNGLLKDTAQFLEMLYTYNTNGIKDNPGTLSVTLEDDQIKTLEAYLKETHKLAGDKSFIDALLDRTIVLNRNEVENIDEANAGLCMKDVQGMPRIDYYHGWAADEDVANLILKYPGVARFASDCMGINGNRSTEFGNLQDKDSPFSMWNYAEQIKNRLDMGAMHGIEWGWSMGGEALRLALVLKLREIEEQLGVELTKEKIDELGLREKLSSFISICEAPAGARTCHFLETLADDTFKDKVPKTLSGGLIVIGHLLTKLGMSDLPGISTVVGGVTDVLGSQLMISTSQLQKDILAVHTDNLRDTANNLVILEETLAILNHEGLTHDDKRLLALAEYVFPRIQVVGMRDRLTAASVQKKLFNEEAVVSNEVGVPPPLSLVFDAGHAIAAETGFQEFPMVALTRIPIDLYPEIRKLLRIRQKDTMKIPMDPSEVEYINSLKINAASMLVLKSGDSGNMTPLNDRLMRMRVPRPDKNTPLQDAIDKTKFRNIDIFSNFIAKYSKNSEQTDALYDVLKFFEKNPNIILTEELIAKETQNYTKLAA